jgi:hypothetical protein
MNADKQVCGRRLAEEQADLVVEVFRMLSDSTDAVHNAEHAAGGVPAHHLDDGELRLLHEEGTG